MIKNFYLFTSEHTEPGNGCGISGHWLLQWGGWTQEIPIIQPVSNADWKYSDWVCPKLSSSDCRKDIQWDGPWR